MKIIGYTKDGYLIEADKYEVQQLTGKEAYRQSTYEHPHTLPVGATIKVREAFEHIEKVTRHDDARKAIADQLRAAATVIETTPSVLTLPEPLTPADEPINPS
jgi:hypothetical protein